MSMRAASVSGNPITGLWAASLFGSHVSPRMRFDRADRGGMGESVVSRREKLLGTFAVSFFMGVPVNKVRRALAANGEVGAALRGCFVADAGKNC